MLFLYNFVLYVLARQNQRARGVGTSGRVRNKNNNINKNNKMNIALSECSSQEATQPYSQGAIQGMSQVCVMNDPQA